MIRWLLLLALLCGAAVFMGACAPADGEGLSGQYHTGYTRAGGEIVIGISGNGSVSVVITDDIGVFSGTGSMEPGRTFTVVCNGLPGTVNVTGAVTGSGTNSTIIGSASGAIAFNYDAIFAHAPDTSLFATSYAGNISGDRNGTLALNVASNGQISGTMIIEGGQAVPVNGSVSGVGMASFSGTSGGVTYSFFGSFRLAGGGFILTHGTWTGSPGELAGEWHGGNTSQ